MINLDDIKDKGVIEILENYEGKNPYIKKFKHQLIKNKKITLTQNQTNYILNNHNFEPKYVNKIVGITEYLGNEFKKTQNISFVPAKILIEYVLGETDKAFHVYGKLKRNQEKCEMYFIPKTQLLDDPYYEEIEVDVDFEKYRKLDTFELSDGTVGRTLYEHQKEGIKFLLSRNGCLLADDMGLGKTIMSIIAALESGAERILIVCPASVKINWEREIHYLQCYDTKIIDGKRWEQAKFTIINYDLLKNFHEIPGKNFSEDDLCWDNQHIVNSNFDLCIIDEAHYLKNPNSIRGSIMKDICTSYGIEKVWLLSGTPVANRPMDFYNLLKLIKSPLADNWKFYVQRYCEGRQITTTLKNGRKKKIWLTNGASNLDELALKTKNLYLRRLKTDISDMPEKNISPVYHNLNKKQRKNYENLWEEYLDERAKQKKRGIPPKDMVELGLLRKFVAMEAIPLTIDMAENIIEQGNKVIIFTNFTDELMEFDKYFGNKCVIHYGEMSDKEKQRSVDSFQQNDNIKVFIGNIKSAGVGITLTEATYVIFNSFSWVPGNNEQAEDRSYRIGQKNNVTVYYQLFNNTVSTIMWGTVKKKQSVIDSIINTKQIDDDESIRKAMEIMLNEIIDNYE